MPGEVRDCFVKGRVQNAAEQLIQARQIRPLIIVGWDGQGPGGPADVTNYLDRADYRMESFMLRELVSYIDRTYRTVPDARFRALDGISAGGYAAPNLVFKHPDVWKVAASHTGFFSPEDDAKNMTVILGPRASNAALWNANDPTKTVLRHGPRDNLHIYLDIGAGDELLLEFKRFAALLKGQGINHEAHVFAGRHTWEYWSNHFFDSLRFSDRHFPFTP
jgi:S-formylglutathione hydrolase FrmB